MELPQDAIEALHQRGWHFYTFIGRGGCRFMCSWDTTEQDVNDFATDIAEVMQTVGKQDTVAVSDR